jgi:xanthine dehydrogenase iron-sulfur cluster and FAD-binding subunit A
MFPRLAEQYRCLVHDLVLSLDALARSLQKRGLAATCYSCGEGHEGAGTSFVANLGTNHMVRFLVSDFGISWVESRDGHELVKLEGADAIQELQRVAQVLQEPALTSLEAGAGSNDGTLAPKRLG